MGLAEGLIVRRLVLPIVDRVVYYVVEGDTVVVLRVSGGRRARQPRFGA